MEWVEQDEGRVWEGSDRDDCLGRVVRASDGCYWYVFCWEHPSYSGRSVGLDEAQQAAEAKMLELPAPAPAKRRK